MAGEEKKGPPRRLTVEELSGGASMDPRTGTVGGPDGPTGVFITDGGAAGEPYVHQGKGDGTRSGATESGPGGGSREAPAGADGQETDRDAAARPPE